MNATRYACPQGCIVTGSDPPPRCKHGKPPMLAWRNFRTGAVDYYPSTEYVIAPDYLSISFVMKNCGYTPCQPNE